jgi:hypothetical protein
MSMLTALAFGRTPRWDGAAPAGRSARRAPAPSPPCLMAQPAAFREAGGVEGFYGRVWSEAERDAVLAGVAPFGLNACLYAPKHKPALGERLLEPLDKATAQQRQRAGGEQLGGPGPLAGALSLRPGWPDQSRCRSADFRRVSGLEWTGTRAVGRGQKRTPADVPHDPPLLWSRGRGDAVRRGGCRGERCSPRGWARARRDRAPCRGRR